MGQFFGIEDIKDLTKASQTTLQWEPGSSLRIGGQSYDVTSTLSMDLATDIDTGAVANDTMYYIYAVVVAGVVGLKYSLTDIPTGFPAHRKIGGLQTDASAEIIETSKKDSGNIGDVMHSRLTEEQFISQNGAGWVLYDNRDITGSQLNAIIPALTTLEDARGRFLRSKDNGAGVNPAERALGYVETDKTNKNGLSATQAVHNHIDGLGADPSTNTRYGLATTSTVFLHNDYGNSGVSFNYNRSANTSNATPAITVGNGDNETAPVSLTVNIFIKIDDLNL